MAWLEKLDYVLEAFSRKSRKWSNILDNKVDKQVCYLPSSLVRDWALGKINNARLPLCSVLAGASATQQNQQC